MARRGRLRRVLAGGRRARSVRRPSTRPRSDWRRPVDGAAPRLGAREYIGHDVRGRGAWALRDPLATPTWWRLARGIGVIGWASLVGGAGWISWRRHGGREALFGEADRSEETS